MPALALHSFSKSIEIPAKLRNQPLDASQTSARLTTLLDRFGIRVLGDLHGRKVVDFAWEKNCGPKTLYELDLLARRARLRNGTASGDHQDGRVHASHTFTVTDGEKGTSKMREDAAYFAIPESICRLPFSELPITKRLANVVRSIGARCLGDLSGRSAFELLQCKACGWRTISEIQQLIERAVSGEFDVRQIEETDVAAELVSLLEQGLAKLPLRDREFVLARIGAQMGRNRSSPGADLLSLSYGEIGRRHGLTRARVHKVYTNTIDSLTKTWGPRIPRLLEVIKWRCLSMVCPLTPQLLERWVASAQVSARRTMTRHNLSNDCRLSAQAHVRLIAALDKSIPCRLETHQKPRGIDGSIGQFDLALARIVRVAGGHMTAAEAYHQLSRWGGRDYRRLTVEKFLQMLSNVKCITVELKDSEIRIVSRPQLNGSVLPDRGPRQDDKLSSARNIHSPSPAVQFVEAKNDFSQRYAAGRR